MNFPRSSGVLLHPTSLPGAHGIGDLGEGARAFVDFLAAAGQSVWQLLPLGPTGYGDSPYNALSAFAGNPLLIDLDTLAAWGHLEAVSPPDTPAAAGHVDFARVRSHKEPLLQQAARTFLTAAPAAEQQDFVAFCTDQAGWLDDFALFTALHAHHAGAWHSWPRPLLRRDPAILAEWRERLHEELAAIRYAQYVFFRQWRDLKGYANSRGVRLFGDLPIFVADDSADVWANQQLFRLDADGRPTVVAGVPPDYFSATGQRWGNPLYNWEALAASGFAWWLARFRHLLQLHDLLRIDHFRGFEACWAIPAAEPTAVNGCWESTPGQELFAILRRDLPEALIVAEDLGVITPQVEALRDGFGFPGMKILQFAFDSGAANPYLPHNYSPDCVVYTGTHDNATTLGWWQNLDGQQRQEVAAYLGNPQPDMPAALVRSAMASVARLCIFPCQDLLGLDDEARFNRPGEAADNWAWRLQTGQLTPALAGQLRRQAERYGRVAGAPITLQK
jgi:4-alpha-glucanotransferase